MKKERKNIEEERRRGGKKKVESRKGKEKRKKRVFREVVYGKVVGRVQVRKKKKEGEKVLF